MGKLLQQRGLYLQKKITMPARPIKEDRQRWYVYLCLKHFKGDTSKCARTMDIPKRSLDQWKEHHYEDMKEFIRKERKADNNGGVLPFEEMEVPTPEALKEECLKRLQLSISQEMDPAKLAKALDTLAKFINPAEKGKDKKSISEMVLESIKNK